MKPNWIFFMFITLFFTSCKTQEIDLADLKYTENYKDLFKDKKTFTEPYDVAAKLPIAYTYETNGFIFGKVNIPENTENEVPLNSVGLLLNNVKERKIVGVKIAIYGVENSKKMLDYLNKEYGNPKMLKQMPSKNKDGWFMGSSAYSWEIKSSNKSLIVSQGFDLTFVETNKGKKYSQNENLNIFIVDNSIKSDAPAYNSITTKELLVKTFSS